MQFVYGDDGLDPANLEGEGKPVDFERTWSHAKVSLSSRITPLLAYRIATGIGTQHVARRTASLRNHGVDGERDVHGSLHGCLF